MFKSLEPLLGDADLTLHLHKNDDGSLRVVCLPKRPDKNLDPALFQPFTLEGHPEELDEQFAELLENYTETREELRSQMARAEAQMREKAEESKRNKKDSASTKSTSGDKASKTGKQGRQTGTKATAKKEAKKPEAGASKATDTKESTSTSAKQETPTQPSLVADSEASAAPADQASKTSPKQHQDKTAQAAEASESDGNIEGYDVAFFQNFSEPALRDLAGQIVPGKERRGIAKMKAATISQKIVKALQAEAGQDGLPQATRDKITAWHDRQKAAA